MTIGPVRKSVLEKEQPLYINQPGQVRGKPLGIKESLRVGGDPKDPAAIDQDAGVWLAVTELLGHQENTQLKKTLDQGTAWGTRSIRGPILVGPDGIVAHALRIRRGIVVVILAVFGITGLTVHVGPLIPVTAASMITVHVGPLIPVTAASVVTDTHARIRPLTGVTWSHWRWTSAHVGLPGGPGVPLETGLPE
jgi:hypothetical protein